MKEARLIVTLECPKDCRYCVNKHDVILQSAKRIRSVAELGAREVVMITGGEPLLDAPRTLRIIRDIRGRLPKAAVYLYTAVYSPFIREVETRVDGIQYTVHGQGDVPSFHASQDALTGHDKSNRLAIDPQVRSITVRPRQWSLLKLKTWLTTPCVPANEDLFIMEPGYDES